MEQVGFGGDGASNAPAEDPRKVQVRFRNGLMVYFIRGASINDVRINFGFLTPSPLPAFGINLYQKIHATSLTMSAFPQPPPPWMRTSYMEVP